MKIDRRDLVTSLAATGAAFAAPVPLARALPLAVPPPTFVRLEGPILSDPPTGPWEDEELMRILRSGYWFIARHGDRVLAIRHSRSGVIFERMPHENDHFAVKAIAIDADRPFPSAKELAQIGRAARFAAINAWFLCRRRGDEGGVFVRYPAAADISEPTVSESLNA